MKLRDDYRLPAEWEPQAATFLAWPHRLATWPGHFDPIPDVYATVARLIARHQPVRIVAGGRALADAKRHLEGEPNISFIEVFTSDGWIRDTAPVFLLPRPGRGLPPLAVCWPFNAWGGKYPPWDLDAAVSGRIAASESLPVVRPSMVLEGGAIETDGEGTLLVNERCVVDPRRNPGLTCEDAETILRDTLGVDAVGWLDGALAGDDTDGHVDQIARFVAPGRVVAARQPDVGDPNHADLEANLRRLAGMQDARGRRLELIPIDIPPRFERHGVQLPASHLNFLVTNGSVLVPVFGGSTDAAAIRTLADCFPGRSIEPVDCRDLVWGRGAIHCITRDEPAWNPAEGR